jgi:hypothetical protein
MGYSGAVASEDSTGERTRRGGITKTGNAHLRRVVIEAAWAYRWRPAVGAALRKRQTDLSPEIKAIAWKAQHRLHARYRHLSMTGKCKQEVVTAVGRELLGFIWAIGVNVEAHEPSTAALPRATRNPMHQMVRSTGGGREAHGKESSKLLCGEPPGSTRALSPRQLPTDHDYAVPTREYP